MVEVPGYRIQRLLSWGSQGDVFLAEDAAGQRVALKIVTPDRADGEVQGAERLQREGRLLAEISSPHVVGVREFLETEEWSCLVLEYLEGQRLDNAVRERAGWKPEPVRGANASTVVLAGGARTGGSAVMAPKVVPAELQTAEHVAWGLEVAQQITRGVVAMHAKELVHRDLKPQNAMVVGERVVLIDFGMARMDGLTTITQSGAAVGTLAFMSPEQFAGRPASTQSDVYGLGAVLFYCLTGSNPIDLQVGNIASLGKRRPPPSVRRKNPAVPKNLDTVLRRAMQPDAEDRYPDAAAMLADLERCRRGEPVRMPFSPGRVWRQRRRQFAWGAALATLALLAWWLFGGFRPAIAAQQLLTAIREKPAMAVDQWSGLTEPQRDEVVAALDQRIGGDAELAESLARTLKLGLLRLDGRARHRGVLLPTNGIGGPHSPKLSEFLSLDRPRCLLVRPGIAWLLVASEDTGAWWSGDDPRVLQLLVDVPEPGSDAVPLRSLRELPTETRIAGSDTWELVPAGVAKLTVKNGKQVPCSFPDAMRVHATEFSSGEGDLILDWLRALESVRSDVDWWLAHPKEPKEAADGFWSWVMTRSPLDDAHMPMQCSFWVAHRIAALLACRLPAAEEWQRIAFAHGKVGTKEQRQVPAKPLPVDAVPEWDEVSGLNFLNSNVAEWSLSITGADLVALPLVMTFESPDGRSRLEWSSLPLFYGTSHPRSAGLRLYRTIVPVR